MLPAAGADRRRQSPGRRASARLGRRCYCRDGRFGCGYVGAPAAAPPPAPPKGAGGGVGSVTVHVASEPVLPAAGLFWPAKKGSVTMFQFHI